MQTTSYGNVSENEPSDREISEADSVQDRWADASLERPAWRWNKVWRSAVQIRQEAKEECHEWSKAQEDREGENIDLGIHHLISEFCLNIRKPMKKLISKSSPTFDQSIDRHQDQQPWSGMMQVWRSIYS